MNENYITVDRSLIRFTKGCCFCGKELNWASQFPGARLVSCKACYDIIRELGLDGLKEHLDKSDVSLEIEDYL